ncbi:MAG: sigma-54 dependent transcriptional regulator, partial [Myxococcota bacterium]
DVVVLLSGEAGAGRSLAAAAIHELSPRAPGPFVRFGCAALAEPAHEAELLGCERPSLAGAMARREGRLIQADGGTLFLDEVSEVPLHTQVKLLRLLQEKRFERVGGNEALEIDTRVIAATRRDLRQAVATGTFREDLFYRLNIIQIELPPLRERSSDIPLLCAAMLARFSEAHAKPVEGFSAEALEVLCCHGWPGNVRELENVVERAVVLSTGASIPPTDLAPLLERRGEAGGARIPGSTLAEIEREAIVKTLDAVRGSTAKAAQMLGISQRKIQYRIREYES